MKAPSELLPSLLSLPTTLYETIFNPHPTSHELLVLVSALSIFWTLIFQILHKTLTPYIQRQSWLREAMGREYDRVGVLMCRALSVHWTRERYIEIMVRDWPKMQGIYLQHFVGGALCLPAVLGWGDESRAASLACLGVLSEMAWELSDMADIFITRSMTSDGKERLPNKMVAIWMIHHSMTLSLGMPLVLKYRNLPELHWMTFNLQWAAAIAIGMNEYTKVLDLSKRVELWTFRLLNGVAFVIMAWMRGFHWLYLSGRLLSIWYRDEEWTFLLIGSVVCVLITGFNFILCIMPFYKKMVKFGPSQKGVILDERNREDDNTLDDAYNRS